MAFDPARAKSLFLTAAELADPAERAAYLDRECGEDAALRARVEALLAADRSSRPDTLIRAIDGLDPTLGETRQELTVPETEPGTEVSGPDANLPTVAATGHGSQDLTLVDAAPGHNPVPFHPGQVIGGRYTLREVLGEGGMGTVFKAEQSQPVRRLVALKLVKVGMDSRTVLARFDAERQALALMDHPNIARVFDGGATDANQPYFVMEFVQGTPITDYCDQHRLPVPARLNLFVAVCQAVQHAHQKGVIHRDLKPSNVLVTEVDGRPTPKVIDFGVAKATETSLTDQTLGDTGAIVGTPTYMSPEQADPTSMDIDTRTDVYALGVILYELLAGSPPIDPSQFKRGALLEMLRMVREVDPVKPSTRVSTADALPNIAANREVDPGQLKHALRGDLDWIVMKALEKDRTRRYETANGLGADILRHLASEPVQAAPPGRTYRLRKFARKHRVGVAAASLVLLALVLGVAGTTWGLVRARHSAESEREARLDAQANERKAVLAAEGERRARLDAQDQKRIAEANERQARAAVEEEKQAKQTVEDVLRFVETRVFAARPKGQEGGLGYEVKLVDAIIAAVPSIAKDLANRPLPEARLRMTIGQTFRLLGKSDLAAAQHEAQWAILSRVLGPDHPQTLNGMNSLAFSYENMGQHAEALKLREKVVAVLRAKLGPDHPDTLNGMNNLALSYVALGRRAEALEVFEKALPLRRAKLGPDHPDTLHSMNNLSDCYADLGRQAEALKLSEDVLAVRRAKLGPDHPDTIKSVSNLLHSCISLGRQAEALVLREELFTLQKAKLGPDHPETLNSMNSLAVNYAVLGRLQEAIKLLDESLELKRAKLGPDHPDTVSGMKNLALAYATLGRHAEALRLREEVVALQRAKLGPDHPETLDSVYRLVDNYFSAGLKDKAVSLLEQLSSANPKEMSLGLLVAALSSWFGHPDEYAAVRKRSLAAARGTSDPTQATSAAKLASIGPSTDRAELDAALALGRLAATPGDEVAERPNRLLALGMAAYRAGDDPTCEAALGAAVGAKPVSPSLEGTAAYYRAMSLHRQGRTDEARKVGSEAAATMKPLPVDHDNPIPGKDTVDDLVLWLAYLEAKALIGFDTPVAK